MPNGPVRSLLRRALVDALALTALAGLIGVARQRWETQQVRAGRLARAGAADPLPPRVRYGRAALRLARWVPPRPASPLGRRLALAWAGPLTLAGFGLARLAGTRPAWDEELGCWVSRGARGPSRAALRAVGASANTVGQVVLAVSPHPSRTLLAHEAVHVRQAERFGPMLLPLYLWLSARYGYRDNPLERAARHGASHSLTGSPDPQSPDATRPR